MSFPNLYIREPIEKVMGDWDFLNERVIGKFSGFKEAGQQVIGVRHYAPTETRRPGRHLGRPKLSEIWLIEPYKGLTKLTDPPQTARHRRCGGRHSTPRGQLLRLLAHQRPGRAVSAPCRRTRTARFPFLLIQQIAGHDRVRPLCLVLSGVPDPAVRAGLSDR